MGHEVGCVTAAEADSAKARIEGMREWKKKKKAAKKAAQIEATKPMPKGINASKPKLTLGVMRNAS
jgi:hypothetical protein